MAVSEICKDGLFVRLVRHDERLFLQVAKADRDETDEGLMPCDPDLLCSVLRGLTYQLASADGYCAIRRENDLVILEYQTGSAKQTCRIPLSEFAKLIEPVLPPRLRAMLF